MALPRLKLLAGRAVLGEREQRLLTVNSLLAMFIALIGNWVGTPAFSARFCSVAHLSTRFPERESDEDRYLLPYFPAKLL
jgi:hypothetical protein